MASKNFEWTDANPACVATYKILAGLMQFKAEFSPAGKLTADSLTYFPKVSPDPAVVRAHASQIAWQYFDRLLKITHVKESPTLTLNQFITRFETLFSNEKTTSTATTSSSTPRAGSPSISKVNARSSRNGS